MYGGGEVGETRGEEGEWVEGEGGKEERAGFLGWRV